VAVINAAVQRGQTVRARDSRADGRRGDVFFADHERVGQTVGDFGKPQARTRAKNAIVYDFRAVRNRHGDIVTCRTGVRRIVARRNRQAAVEQSGFVLDEWHGKAAAGVAP